jgi:glycerol-3-phosphate acyltransferase PlsY
MNWYWYIAVALATYFIGSLSFGALIARLNQVDIFTIGSGNPGATNVKRTVGNIAGNLVFVLDFLKGLVPVLVIEKLRLLEGYLNTRLALLGLIGILLGHSFSIFHHFRGGKGISSAIGGLSAIMPNVLIVGIFLWLTVFYTTRIVSVASLCFTASILLTSYLFSYSRDCIVFSLILNIIVFYRHKENIMRLIKNTEYKFTKKN